jgi:hypothetical protein
MSVFNLEIPIVFFNWLAFEVLDMLRELQLMLLKFKLQSFIETLLLRFILVPVVILDKGEVGELACFLLRMKDSMGRSISASLLLLAIIVYRLCARATWRRRWQGGRGGYLHGATLRLSKYRHLNLKTIRNPLTPYV